MYFSYKNYGYDKVLRKSISKVCKHSSDVKLLCMLILESSWM